MREAALGVGGTAARLDELLRERIDAGQSFFAAEAEPLARLCHQMAERFSRGGTLIAFGRSPAARSDARHVAVEFVHPVIVGKRALPAIGLAGEGGDLRAQVELVARPDDIAIAFGTDEDGGEAAGALAIARARGCLTIAFSPSGAEWEPIPPSVDPYVRQELIETLYHVLWELVHVFFDHRGLLKGRDERRTHDAGASSFLYPFLDERETELEPVVDDVRRSVLMKAQEIAELRAQTLTDNRDVLLAAASALRSSFERGGKMLALGNGGSATDAMDAVADFRAATGGRGRPALDLTDDPAILTAIANDIGVDAIFSRQVIAYGQREDALLALSTSGNSRNVIAALAQARAQGLLTIALVGYDGGQVREEGLADHVVVTRSEHIPRIQEAQASAYHALRTLVERAGEARGEA
jgi:D-sedoheptulose 7-phosphate isomerase